MGAPKKWIKTLLGLKRSSKTQSTEKADQNDENSSVSAGKNCHPTETSVHNDTGVLENKLSENGNVIKEVTGAENANFLSVPETVSSPSIKLREELAAIQIQTAIRGYLTSVSAAKICKNRKPSIELNENRSVITKIEDEEDAKFQSVSESANMPSTSLQVQNAAWVQPSMSEEQAAIHIQTAYRGFLARRSLRGLRGLVRLQALVRGHAVRKQAAITLRCMQALVRVQARVRARRVRVILENQTAQQKIQQQLERDAQVKEVEAGWCGGTGSAEEVQAKLLKRKEAAAKREKAKAYALARQWQASSRQQLKPAEFEPDRSNWGWNWLERWMAVRPWENNNILELKIGDIAQNVQPADSPDAAIPKSNPKAKKPMPSNRTRKIVRSRSKSDIPVEKKNNSHSDGYSSSPEVRETPRKLVSSSSGSKPVAKKSVKEASTSRQNVGPRSRSTPRERSTAADKQGNKRLSLPGTGDEQRAQPARQLSQTKRTPNAPKPVKPKTKPNSTDVKPLKVSPQIAR